jgi:ABC-type protease/lipase transport system fused ATPase/permease subunit
VDRANRYWRGPFVGVWPRLRGKIKLDKAALEHWSPDAPGKHIG